MKASLISHKLTFVEELRAQLGAIVDDSEETRLRHATNFGGAISKYPAAVIYPKSKADIVATLQFSQQADVPVSVRGSGHCCGQQSLCENGIVIVNRGSRSEPQLLTGDVVEVCTGDTWAKLEQALNYLGRSIPVLTSELHTTVGGTLSVGGYGAGTIAHRGQVDLVEQIRLLLPDGQTILCSRTRNRDLFYFGLGSLGQLGFIERVVLRTVPYVEQTRIYIYRFADLLSMIQFMNYLAEEDFSWVEFFFGQHYEGQYLATCGIRVPSRKTETLLPMQLPLPERLIKTFVKRDWQLRSLHEERRNKWSSTHSYVWNDYVVDLKNALSFARFVALHVLASPAYQRYAGRILILTMRNPEAKETFPFEPIAPEFSQLAIGFGLYFCVPKDDPMGLMEIKNIHTSALRQCILLGGRPYLAGWQDLDDKTRQLIYGESYFKLQQLRQLVDPKGLFNRDVFFMSGA